MHSLWEQYLNSVFPNSMGGVTLDQNAQHKCGLLQLNNSSYFTLIFYLLH